MALLLFYSFSTCADAPFSHVESIAAGIRQKVFDLEKAEPVTHPHGGVGTDHGTIYGGPLQPLGRCESWNYSKLKGEKTLREAIHDWAESHVAANCFVETRHVLLEDPGNPKDNHIFVLALVACSKNGQWDHRLLKLDLWPNVPARWCEELKPTGARNSLNCLGKLIAGGGFTYVLEATPSASQPEKRTIWISANDSPPRLRIPYQVRDFEVSRKPGLKTEEKIRLPTYSDNIGIKAGIMMSKREEYAAAVGHGITFEQDRQNHEICDGLPFESFGEVDRIPKSSASGSMSTHNAGSGD